MIQNKSSYKNYEEYREDIWYYKLTRKLDKKSYSEGIFKGRGVDEYCSGFRDKVVYIPSGNPEVHVGKITDGGKKIFEFLDEFHQANTFETSDQKYIPFETIEILTHGFPDEKTVLPLIDSKTWLNISRWDFFFFINADKNPYSVIHRYYKDTEKDDYNNYYHVQQELLDNWNNPYNTKIGYNTDRANYRSIQFAKFADTRGTKYCYGDDIVKLFLDAFDTLA
jgi:hypothetical protein